MKCHYEVLEVERNAEDDEIKRNYRKLALKWHPDKNPDDVENCTAQFRLLQQAYDVLSDSREREFYDRHRESILKGASSDFEEKSVDLFPYFSASCYSGYENEKNGFYAVYRKVFNILVTEEYDPYNDNNTVYPDFGDKDSDHESVVINFYGFWSSFSTSRSFAWLDHYDITQASNRYELRKIEQENKRYRDAGKEERNDQIRQLAAFVRKRDPRIKAYRETLEKNKVEAQQKQVENRKKQIARNQEMANAYLNDKDAQAARLAHLIEVGVKMAEEYDSCSDECDEDGEELPYCVVCNKSFKTINAKLNHENSKQHLRQLNELKKHMKDEDATLFEAHEDNSEDPTQSVKGKKNRRKGRRKGNGIFDSGIPDVLEEIEPAIEKPVNQNLNLEKEAVQVVSKEKKKRRAEKSKAQEIHGEILSCTDPKTATCDKCGAMFDSRTKLFSHLEQTGHATLINKQQAQNRKNKKINRSSNDEW